MQYHPQFAATTKDLLTKTGRGTGKRKSNISHHLIQLVTELILVELVFMGFKLTQMATNTVGRTINGQNNGE